MRALPAFLVFALCACRALVAADPQVGFTATLVDTAEATSGTPVVLTITRDVAATGITVGFTVEDTVSPVAKRATVVSDYAVSPGLLTASTGEVSFPSGVFSRTITITLVDDGSIEGEEFIRFRLLSGAGYSVNGAVSSVQVTIADNDLVATVFNDRPGASEDSQLINENSGHDPGDARRGVMRVQFNAQSTFDKNLQATFIGTALINTDYALTYKIGGNAMNSGLGFTTVGAHAVGDTQVTVQGGLGDAPGLAVGDVFSFPSPSTARHVITAVPGGGVIQFRRFSGGIAGSTGLDVAITANTALNTIFTSTSPIVNVTIPRESTRIEFGVTPGGASGPANDGVVEGAEYVTMVLAASNNYALGDPDTGAVTIADVDSTASIALTANAIERDTPGTFTVTLTPPFSRTVTVPYTIGGTATAGVDYSILAAGSIDVPASGTATITVNPLGTAIPPAGKSITLTITDTVDYRLADGVLTSSSATMTILPTTGTVSVAKTTDGVEGGANGLFTVTLERYAGHETEAITVGYTVSGSSTAGSDYTSLSGNVVIAGNATTATIPVTVTNDTLAEDDETVTIALSTGSSYRLAGAASATVTIGDDEPVISVSAPVDANEGGAAGTFTIGYTGAARGIAYPVTFALSGTATSPGDYSTTTPTTVTIPGAANSVQVSIAAADNTVAYTPARTVILTITPPGMSGTFHLGTAAQTLEIIDNEPRVEVGAAMGASASEGGATAVFTVTLDQAAPTGGLTVPFTFSGVPGADYTADPATAILFPAGETTRDVTITAVNNAVADPARTLTLVLTPPTSPGPYFLGDDDSASLALADNDVGVSDVTSPSDDGTYVLGDTITIVVTFSAPVTTTGSPTLMLDIGSIPRTATFVSVVGATATFTYTVQAGDASSDLDYASPTALSGAFTSAVGTVDATLPDPGEEGSLGDNKDLVVDGSLTGGKPAPGTVGGASGGGCGIGSGFAALGFLCMLAGFALSIRRGRA
jgi:hypothetical protein